jgi:hypothetical protein
VDEFFISGRRLWLLARNRRAVAVKEPDAAPIDVAAALPLQRIGRVEQPERRPDAGRALR